MSENKTQEIREQDLDNVTGGSGNGSDHNNAIEDERCWFVATGETRNDGRMKCQSECIGKFNSAGEPVKTRFDGTWYKCKCHGSGFCVGKWHLHGCGHPKRY